MAVKTLPKILTVVDWNQKKGLIAKAAVATGLSQALFELDQAWEKVNWEKLDPERAMKKAGGGNLDLNKLAQLHRAALAEFNRVHPVMNALLKVEVTAQGAEGKYLAAKIRIPASSKRQVQLIAAEAKRLSDELDGIDNEWEAHRRQIMGKLAVLRKIIPTNIEKVEAGLAAVLKTPTKAMWTHELHDAIRGLGVQVSNQPDLKAKYRPRTNVYSSAPFVTNQRYPNPQAERTDVLRKYKLVLELLDEIKADL